MKILYQQPNGVCAIVTPLGYPTETLEQVIEKAVPSGIPYVLVEDAAIPTDRTYRNAWVIDGGTGAIVHDMAKAREIHRSHMRRVREPLLTALDTAYIRADERGGAGNADKLAIAARKQALRDVTANAEIEAAGTVETLKTVWPSVLGQNPLEGGM